MKQDRTLRTLRALMLGKMAETAVEQAYLALDGGTPEKEIVLPVTLLTRDNVADYGTGWWQ